ncbi:MULTISPECIES: hypothetical protein [Serratia]|uniref:hypothetical protein n=1 Tax=Serratia TaxID=613 RepID=UPI0006502CED|nr:hypothetical protein [Serratia marcescens]AVU35683.1 hypothetical protein AM681_14105 [Serratia marcescens]AVU40789.1 hypothetical protein AS658_13955 [Serratia marcescens]EIU0887495.1 hypothetical protein [Serratia marcescens]KLX13378.1 hypothetical protein SK68_03247 [Serratia marcescens]KMJ10571.1 hypothetical protein SN03_03119 [Serratia marcescens]
MNQHVHMMGHEVNHHADKEQPTNSAYYSSGLDLLRRGTEDEIIDALVAGEINKDRVYRFRCDEATQERIEITGRALKAANRLARQMRKAREAQNNDLAAVLATIHPGDPDDLSDYVLDELQNQMTFASIAYGIDMTMQQAISLAVFHMAQSQQAANV